MLKVRDEGLEAMVSRHPLLKKIIQRTSIDSCHVCLPFFSFAFSQDAVSKIHRHALNPDGRRVPVAKVVFFSLYWPARAIALALMVGAKADRDLLGIEHSRAVLVFMLWHAMVRHNMTAESFFQFRLWRSQSRRRVNEFIQVDELGRLLPWLNREKDIDKLIDKAEFAKLCHESDLPYAGLITTISNGVAIMPKGQQLPMEDLFTKFNGQSCGSGGQAWIYDPDTMTWRSGSNVFDEPGLLEHLKEAAGTEAILVQEKLKNSPALERLSSGALCTFRVITFKLPNKAPQHLRSSLRMAVGQADVDNFAAGGVAANVAPSGVLTQAIAKYGSYQTIDIHPDTGKQISGTIIEGWDEVLALAKLAHARITDIYAVGWDIALTPDGPFLIEGNVRWDQGVIQMPNCDPLGKEFCDLYLAVMAASAVDR